MDIRDEFAMHAMQAIIQSEHQMEAADLITDANENICIQEAIAMLAYVQADFMIQIRDKIIANEGKIEEVAETKKLKSLSEFNAKARAIQSITTGNTATPNGIACPNCGEEMVDSNPMITLTSYPAQKDVHCPSCKYSGYRIA